jgi:ribonucleoside-diphosphate reductase alpha chain
MKLKSFQNFLSIFIYLVTRDGTIRKREGRHGRRRYGRYTAFFKKRSSLFPEDEIKEAILTLKVMPSMRCLMTAGAALDRDNIAGYNCSYVAIDHPRAFDEILYILMCGTGVGFSVERQFINSLPLINEDMYSAETIIQVHDSRIGWATAFRQLIALLYAGQIPRWDLTKLRPKGARLKTFGGRASGPEPLNHLFQFCVDVFRKAAGRKLNSLECHDIVCKIADIVIVGGVRRSALISLSNLSDDRMRNAKNGQWWISSPQRALANNSVAYTEKPEIEIFLKEWLTLIESKSGERGIFNRVSAIKKIASTGRRKVDGYQFGTNPCGEILLRSAGLCNLSEVVIRPEDTLDDLLNKVRLATIIGTFQSTLTDFRYLRSLWKKNSEEEHLLGVSMTGIMDHPVLSQVGEEAAEWLRTLRAYSVDVNIEWAARLGIEPSAAVTCVKPSGTVAELVGTSSGIHPRFAKYYVRAVRNDSKDPLARLMVDAGVPYEPDQTNPSNILVFSFPKKSPNTSVMRNHITAVEQLEHYRMVRQNWCEHNPSCFSGSERFITINGLMLFSDAVNTKQMVLTPNGFKEATIHSFGRQKIWEIELLNHKKRKVIRTTENHLFPVAYPHQREANYNTKFIETKNLPIGKQLVTVVPQNEPKATPFWTIEAVRETDRYEEVFCAIEPETHQFVLEGNILTHNCTIYVKPDEWLEVGSWIYKNWDDVGGVSFLPFSDHVYQQAPFQEINEDDYNKLENEFPEVDYLQISQYEKEDTTTSSHELACTGNSCSFS